MPTLEEHDLNQALTETLAQTLETMAFICPEPLEALNPEDPLADIQRVRVAYFNGEQGRGALELTVSQHFGSALIADLVDDDAAITEAADNSPSANDALIELANMTCGLLLRKFSWIAPGKHTALTLPVIQSAQGEAAARWIEECRAGGCVALTADEGWIAAKLILTAA